MTIYMNGKATLFENIFDAVAPNNSDYWHRVSIQDTGREITDILSDWVNDHCTYYYLNGIKTNFELRN